MNNKLYNVYLKCINPSIILQQDQQDLDQQDLEGDIQQTDDTEQDDNIQQPDDTEQGDIQEDSDPQEQDSKQQKDDQSDDAAQKSDADLKFSADLASEFGNTVNKFTRAAAQVIKQRTINKEQSDNIYNLMGKIKDLLDAASKSV